MEEKGTEPGEGKEQGQDHLASWGPRSPSGSAQSARGSVAGQRSSRHWEKHGRAAVGDPET